MFDAVLNRFRQKDEKHRLTFHEAAMATADGRPPSDDALEQLFDRERAITGKTIDEAIAELQAAAELVANRRRWADAVANRPTEGERTKIKAAAAQITSKLQTAMRQHDKDMAALGVEEHALDSRDREAMGAENELRRTCSADLQAKIHALQQRAAPLWSQIDQISRRRAQCIVDRDYYDQPAPRPDETLLPDALAKHTAALQGIAECDSFLSNLKPRFDALQVEIAALELEKLKP